MQAICLQWNWMQNEEEREDSEMQLIQFECTILWKSAAAAAATTAHSGNRRI